MFERPVEDNSVTTQMLLAAKQALQHDSKAQQHLMETIVGDLLINDVLKPGDDHIVGAITDLFTQKDPSQETKRVLSKLDADAKRPVEESWGLQPTTSTVQSSQKEEHARDIRSCIIKGLCHFLRPNATGVATADTLVSRLEGLINTATDNDIGKEAKESALNALQRTIKGAFEEKNRSKVAAQQQKRVPPPTLPKPKPKSDDSKLEDGGLPPGRRFGR